MTGTTWATLFALTVSILTLGSLGAAPLVFAGLAWAATTIICEAIK